jgi:antimicrobial peptide system SdpB family protein
MRRLTDVGQSLLSLALRWDSRGRQLAVGRSLLAVASLSELVFTGDIALFGGRSGCGGIGSFSLWCVSSVATHGMLLARVVSIAVLVLVLSGYRPRWTCIPHWYVTFSLFSALVAPNGGDGAAAVGTLLLIPICLGDTRAWQWNNAADAPSPAWRGSAFAAHMVFRLQIFIIYIVAVISKISDSAWSRGVAMYYVFHDPEFGIPADSWSVILGLANSGLVVRALSWSVIVLQLFIAVGGVGPRKFRFAALVAGVGLHVAIIFVMGLPSFGLAMIGLLLIGYGGGLAGADRAGSVRIRSRPEDSSASSLS